MRNWNLLAFWKRCGESNFFQFFKSVSSENVQDFEIISTMAKLLKGRVLLVGTVKMMETVEPPFPCRNAGTEYQ